MGGPGYEHGQEHYDYYANGPSGLVDYDDCPADCSCDEFGIIVCDGEVPEGTCPDKCECFYKDVGSNASNEMLAMRYCSEREACQPKCNCDYDMDGYVAGFACPALVVPTLSYKKIP